MSSKRLNNMGETVNRRHFIKTVGATGIVGLAGCAGGGGGGGGGTNGSGGATTGGSQAGQSSQWKDLSGTELHFVNSDNSEESQQYWNKVTKAFGQATGASINMEFTGIGTSHEQRVTQLLQAGDPPELDWVTQSFAATAASQGILADVTPAVQYLRERLGEPMESGRVVFEGQDQIVPAAIAPGTFWHRTDLQSYSEPPDTWDKCSTYVQQSHQLNNPQNGIYLARGQGSHASSHHLSWAYSNNATMCTRNNGEVVCHIANGNNRTRWIELLEFYKELSDYSPLATDSSWSAMQNSIANKTSASVWYSGVRPKNAVIDQGVPFAEGVSNLKSGMPLNSDNGQTRAGGNGISVYEGSNVETALEFVKFWGSESDNYPTIRDLPFTFAPAHNLLAYREALESDWYWERTREVTAPEWTDAQLKTLLYQETQNMLAIPNETSPPNPYAGAIVSSNAIQDMMAEATVDDRDPETLLDEYQQKINNVISDSQ